MIVHKTGIFKISNTTRNIAKGIVAVVAAVLLLQACNSSDDDDVGDVIGFAYVDELDAVYEPFQPEEGAAIPAAARAALVSANLPYPPFNAHNIKSIGPNGWKDRDQLVNASVGDVIFNQLWSTWQPTPNLSLRDPNTFEYDGMVWRIDPVREKQIEWYSSRGINVTVVLYATPEWARPSNTSKFGNVPLVHPHFIAPDNPADFARFAGMIAKRFNGANGNGRAVNFIIQNEINSLDWFNPGCGKAEFPCQTADRIQAYANVFNQAYDRIKLEQPEAKVFMSFDHHFGDVYNDSPRFASAQQYMDRLDPLVAPRQWRLAFHSYPSDLFAPNFGPFDLPKVTFGNLGVLAGWLRQRFPDKPHAWEIHLTENGINASTQGSSEAAQNQMLPVATRNVLGTPGVNNFVYHRIQDHENEGAFQPGLHNSAGRAKPAWNVWARNNLYQNNPPRLSNGYEDLPYTRLVRYVKPGVGHWASTRQPPEGFTAETSFLLLREELPNTTMLYECHVPGRNTTRITPDLSCGGHNNFGPVGYSFNFNDLARSRQGIFSIETADGNHVLTNNSEEVPGVATVLGFADSSKLLKQPIPQRDLFFYDNRFAPNSPPSAIASQPAAQQVINALGTCSDSEMSCHFLSLTVAPNQSNVLSCAVQDAGVPLADIVLNFGNTTFSRSVVVAHQVNQNSGRYTIPLPIRENAAWATVQLSSKNGAPTDHCYIVQSGTLAIGAAEEFAQQNLLQNGGFENVLTDWELCAGNGDADFSNNAHLGGQSIAISDGNCTYQEVQVEVGTEYGLECYGRHDGPGVGTLKLGFANGSFQKLSETELPVSGAEFEAYNIADTAPAGSIYAVVSFESGVGTGYLDTCSLVEN